MQLDNLLIRPGKVVMRNPFTGLGSIPNLGQTFAQPVGVVITDSDHAEGAMVIVGRSNSPTAVVDNWNAPLVNASAAQLATNTSKLCQVNLASGSNVTATITNSEQAPGTRWVNFNGLIYGISYSGSSSGTDQNGNYNIWKTSLYTMPAKQTAGSMPTITNQTNAPHGAFDLIGYQARIWMLGGFDTPGGLANHEPTTLFWTRPLGDSSSPALGVPLGSLGTDWKDPTTGIVNKIQMDGDQSDFGVGLAVVRNGLLVFRRASVWILRGSTTQNYALVPISREVGCVDARSILETDHGVYFMSHRGLMLTNGTTVVNVSGNVSRNLAAMIQIEQRAVRGASGAAGVSGWITCALTSQGQIMVSIGTNFVNGGNVQMVPQWSGMYDPEMKIWTRHTSQIWARQAPLAAASGCPGLLVGRPDRNQLFEVDDAGIVELENFNRISSLIGTTGQSFLLRGTTENVFADYTLASNTDQIQAVWKTRLVPINVTKRKLGIPLRFYLDHSFAWSGNGGGASAVGGWRVTPYTAAGVQLNSPQSFTHSSLSASGQGEDLATPLITRNNIDWSSEIADMYFQVDASPITYGTGAFMTDGMAEIYGVGMEYQNTSPVR